MGAHTKQSNERKRCLLSSSVLVLDGVFHNFVVSNGDFFDTSNDAARDPDASVACFQAFFVFSQTEIILQRMDHHGFADDRIWTLEGSYIVTKYEIRVAMVVA